VLAASNAITERLPALPDDDGHGTQVAAAAAGAAGLVAGISPTSPVMPIRIATASLLATPATIVKGLEIAVARKARVAVLPSSQPLSQVAEGTVTSVGLALSAAFSEGVITVVPAGNEGENETVFPGTLAHALTVGSAGTAAARDEFSNTGPWLDLMAPGADLILPAPPSICLSGYARASGTSFSAGAVAGAVALVAAARPRLTTAGLYDLIRRSSSTNMSTSGFDVTTGFGLLDVGAGLTATAAAADPYEVNDNVYWLKRRPTSFPTYLRRTRVATTRGSVSPGKDPQDAFKVYLRRGDLLRASVSNANAGAVLYASIWSTRTGDFDMRLPAPSSELRSAGFTQNPRVSYRATRTGTYYVAVFAPAWTVPGEQGTIGKDLAPLSPPRSTYRLTMTRRR
jgi:subtilisin family serine protease